MFKLFKGELKKIFLRPSIFIMTALLAIIITFSYYFYQPMSRVNTSIQINGSSVMEIYDKFNSGNDIYSKNYAQSVLDSALETINSYEDILVENNKKSPVTKYKEDISKINTLVIEWNTDYKAIIDNPTASLSDFNRKTIAILSKVDQLHNIFSIDSKRKNPVILLTVTTYSSIDNSLSKLIEKLNNAVAQNNRATYKSLYEYFLTISTTSKLVNFNYDIINLVNQISDIEIKSSFVESLKIDYYNLAVERLNNLETEITEFANQCTTTEDQQSAVNKNKLNEYISFYNATCVQMNDILSTKVKLEIAKGFTDNQFTKFVNCGDFNRYEFKQRLVRQQFLFDNNKAEYEYATSLSFSSVSNFEPNAYDFTYYVLELFSFLIIVYCVILGSSMIAGEQNNGTLKLLAIRPFSRGKILFSKIFATMFFMIIFVLLSTAISMIAGSVLFGLDSMPLLLIYDASIPIATSPLIALVIYLVSLIVRISVYIILSIALSTIFRSHIVATTVSILLLFVTSIFGMFFTGAIFFKYLPLNNLDLFKFFGGGRFPSENASVISSLFSSPILPDTSFMFSFTVICVTIALLIVLTYQVFKRRDIA